MAGLNETHDPNLRSWLAAAAGSEFPIQNLPYGSFRRRGGSEAFRIGVAIGDQVLDVPALLAAGALDGEAAAAARLCGSPTLNALMAAGPARQSALRLALSRGLREGSAQQPRFSACLIPQGQIELALPAQIGDFTDFYASIHHATRVGRLFRPDNPLMPNYQWLPVAYHGRSSSIRVSGGSAQRPCGQLKGPNDSSPRFAPSERIDYELELGFHVGVPTQLGETVPLAEAEGHLFGVSLLNDWSARDIQAWEYQPLGPFLAKNFATHVSPWVVTMEALEPYRTSWDRPADHPAPLAHLESEANRTRGAIDITIEAWIQTARMQAEGLPAERLSRSSFAHSYWTVAQMLTHHASNGCNLVAGDLIGTGTQSGPRLDEAGCLLELTEGGRTPIALSDGETRRFVEDGDTIIFRGYCEREGFARISLGECAATIVAAVA
jgi:fumarylacetoacetase